jgi:hypothetical protein
MRRLAILLTCLALTACETGPKAWGGIPIGGAHALIAVATDAGVIIVEPQTRATISLDEYPNRDHIFAVKIGG